MAASVDYSRLTTYDRDKPYIFVSYAHKDSETVVPIIRALQEHGYRIWFDLGIEAGTEWSNNIAAHLKGCAAFVVFASRNCVQSENCLDEIAFAKAHQKPSLMIFLEDNVALPEGTEMQTARFQRMFRTRHHTHETFIQKICEATMLDCCREGRHTPPAPAAKPDRKLHIAIALCAVLLIAAVAVFAIALGGKSSAADPTEPPPTEPPVTEATEPEQLTMSDDLMDYTFTLDGIVYQLPCAFSAFTDAGWTISSSGYSTKTTISGEDYDSFRMSNNGHNIYISVYNYSGNTRQLADCPVGGIECKLGDGPDFFIAKGLTPAATVEEITAAFGSPNERYSGSDYTSISYNDPSNEYNGVAFFCYTDEAYAEYSSITLRNFVKLSSDATETSAVYPDYLNDYVAPTELGTDLTSGIISIDGDLYQLPAPVSAFLDNGWSFTKLPGYVVAGGYGYVDMERNGLELSVRVMNFSDFQTRPENCAVYSVSFSDYDDQLLQLPLDLTIGSTLTQVQSAVTDQFTVYEGYGGTDFTYSEYTSERDFTLSISVSADTGTVDWIVIQAWTWDH